MVDGATLGAPLARTSGAAVAEAQPIAGTLPLTVTTTHRISDVEAVWRRLEAGGIESPGQSCDFIRQWPEALGIAENDQLYVVASRAGQPAALLPLHRRRRQGVRLFSWLPGSHVGCGAPLLDAARFAALSIAERRGFWQGVMGQLKGADLVDLRAGPERANGIEAPFAELGRSLPVETLYRATFASWDEANTTQRSKSRRKHDRQQGERLEALGQVGFEVVECGAAAGPVLDEMIRQRARRFVAMGVSDPFAPAEIARFYQATVASGSAVPVKLHVLRLDGEIVAVRYNIVYGDRLFCLLSSMSHDERIQGGSPGKQCLLRVMQSVFDEGFRVFDMGNGLTDEKRHWCNEQIGLRNHYVPLSATGRLIILAHGQSQALRARIKGNARLLKLAKGLRAKLQPRNAKADTPAATD